MEKTEIKKRIEKLLGTPAPEDWETNPDYKLSIVDIIAMFGNQPEPQVTPKIVGTDTKSILIHFLDDIRSYERESHNLIGFDERETEEFVNIYLNGNGSNFSE